MPHPAILGAAIYTAWQLGYFDDWGWSTKPPTPEDLDQETIRDVMAKYGDGAGMPDASGKAGFDPCQCCHDYRTKHCCDTCKKMGGSGQSIRENKNKTMRPNKLKKSIKEELRRLKRNKGPLNEIAPAVAAALYFAGGGTIGGLGAA